MTTTSSNPHGTQEMQHCIQECTNCHTVCTQTVNYCLEQGGKHAQAQHIGLLLDCVEICSTSADFMLRGSSFHAKTCGVCADVCERCAQSCDQFGDDEQMKACAQARRSCASSCQQMAA